MKQRTKSVITLLAMTTAYYAICVAQTGGVIPVKSLEQGNVFLYRSTGQYHGGQTWNTWYNDVVLGDSLINGKTFHLLSQHSLEYSDSVVLTQFSGGVERVVCDFSRAVGDTIYEGGTAWLVTGKGVGTIFSDTQPYMSMAGPLGPRTVFKRFGVTYKYELGPQYWARLDLLGARINGVIYGQTPPASVAYQEAAIDETVVGVFPNPTSSGLNFQIRVQEASELKIEVFNILGQRVGRVYDAVIGKGESVMPWNSFDIEGRTLSSGVYLVRFEVNTRSLFRRIVLVQ